VLIGGPAVVLGMFMLWRLLRYRQGREKHAVLARLIAMDSGRELNIHTTVYRIGRAPDNELCLENDSVSAHHAELHRRRDGTFSIFDLASTNGVWVNGKAINNYSLRNDDIVELGEVRLRFRELPR
jgi:pSer/pThr/pTyr-binding forkhead associated (FHA) protein